MRATSCPHQSLWHKIAQILDQKSQVQRLPPILQQKGQPCSTRTQVRASPLVFWDIHQRHTAFTIIELGRPKISVKDEIVATLFSSRTTYLYPLAQARPRPNARLREHTIVTSATLAPHWQRRGQRRTLPRLFHETPSPPTHMTRIDALIVAAGSGERFGSPTPKQYLCLDGEALVRRSVKAFLDHPRIRRVRVVMQPVHGNLYRSAVEGLNLPPPIAGGATRQDSCRLGLQALAQDPPDWVLIHDAARPLVDSGIIDRVCGALEQGPAAIAAVPVVDTLKREANGVTAGTVDRTGLWRAQTPQGFHYASIVAAHHAVAGASLTDDAAVAERASLPVQLVLGDEDNLKVTTTDDLARAERLLRGQAKPLTDIRTGFGFDVHRLVPGDQVILCGVPVPHTHRLDGHSDADVALHALTDALLGTIGAGDIGQHFPPSDPQWRGADSALFLRHVVAMVEARGGRIANVDVTILCERPKIGPHREAMAVRLADLLGIDRDRVNVKATTTERLGFTGREEGIAAQAAATVRLPE